MYARFARIGIAMLLLVVLTGAMTIVLPGSFWMSNAQTMIGGAFLVTALVYLLTRRRHTSEGLNSREARGSYWIPAFGVLLLCVSFGWLLLFPEFVPHPGKAGTLMWIAIFFAGILFGGILVAQSLILRR